MHECAPLTSVSFSLQRPVNRITVAQIIEYIENLGLAFISRAFVLNSDIENKISFQ